MKRPKTRILTALAITLLWGGGASASAASQVWNCTLLPASTFTEDCLGCDRVVIAQSLRGTWQLRLLEENPIQSRYAVEAIAFATEPGSGTDFKVRGQGTYTVGGEVALRQEMVLDVWIDNGTANRRFLLTNDSPTVERWWPLLKVSLSQSNGTLGEWFRMDLAAAPCRELWFSTTHSFHAGIWSWPTNFVSPGDLVSTSGRVVLRNNELTAFLGIMPMVPDLGLDAAVVLPDGEIGFSTTADAFSEALGPLSNGDILSDRGRIVFLNGYLISAFDPAPGTGGAGLDAVWQRDAGEVWFSVTNEFFSRALNQTVRRGDLLSSRGFIVRRNEDLVARFLPADNKRDYGLDAIHVWSIGEIWFSVETSFYGSHFESYAAGDVLSDQGYVVLQNRRLMGAFQPLEELADFGLDTLCLLNDATSPPGTAVIPRFEARMSDGTMVLELPATNGLFQLERAATVLGPWIPISPVTSGPTIADPGVLTNQAGAFYRLRAW